MIDTWIIIPVIIYTILMIILYNILFNWKFGLIYLFLPFLLIMSEWEFSIVITITVGLYAIKEYYNTYQFIHSDQEVRNEFIERYVDSFKEDIEGRSFSFRYVLENWFGRKFASEFAYLILTIKLSIFSMFRKSQ